MHSKRGSNVRALLSLLGVVVASGVLFVAMGSGAALAHDAADITVMTQNLYIGTDLNPILSATTFPQLLGATGASYLQMQASDFPARARALAKVIGAAQPDVVGLQEVSLIRIGPGLDPAPATTVTYDYLAILLQALQARGLHYAVAGIATDFDLEVPALLPGGLTDVRLTDREVMLVRADLNRDRPSISNVQSSRYATNLSLVTLGGPVTLYRGWVSADVSLKGQDKKVRVVTTHLEPFHAGVQMAQGQELLAGPGRTALPVIFMGDYNSNADGIPVPPTYATLIAAGLQDAWLLANPCRPGYTWGQAADLLNPTSTLSERLDLVLLQAGSGKPPLSFMVDDAKVVGARPANKTPSGLWPSDHGGLVVSVEIGRH
jgi:hypothetical protein